MFTFRDKQLGLPVWTESFPGQRFIILQYLSGKEMISTHTIRDIRESKAN